MKTPRFLPFRRALAAALLGLLALGARANTAIEPVPRDPRWVQMHESFVELAKKGDIDVLFLGDSITDFWRNRGKAVWDANFAPLHAANFGISADRTQHVLWRLEHGEVDGLNPKVVVLLIGTNNTGVETNGSPRNTTDEAIQGITLVVHTLLTRLPHSKILLLGLFPRADPKGPPPGSDAIKQINATLAHFDDGKIVRFLDIGPKFLAPDGTLPKDIMPDSLHPSPKGYEIWAAAIKEPLAEMMKQ
ncbi:MAG TPA: GDSL-type esterase/lipase family protein [Opitutaceae bacterium]|nr:GDSL-type esterase/lipase family protein [Opitutaceae bacterium]